MKTAILLKRNKDEFTVIGCGLAVVVTTTWFIANSIHAATIAKIDGEIRKIEESGLTLSDTKTESELGIRN